MGLSVKLLKRVNGFTLDVEWRIGNELTVLFGHSGAGKSMTLQLIAGLLKPDEGHIRSNGKSFYESAAGVDVPPQERSFGYVFQDLALFPHMTVMNNILYGARGIPGSQRKERAKEMINSFRLDAIENRYPREISGGEKQRTAFARALIREPSTLLLDEPFSALDTPLRLEMRGFLRKVRDTFKIPVILVTHDVTETYTMADKVIVYSGGSVLSTGTPDEVFENPSGAEGATPAVPGDRDETFSNEFPLHLRSSSPSRPPTEKVRRQEDPSPDREVRRTLSLRER